MVNRQTLDLEHQAREELLSSIGIYVDDITPGGYNVFLHEFLGIEDAGDLLNMSIPELQKIAEAFENFIF